MQPKATIHCPLGEVSLEEKKTEEVEKVLSVNGILKGHILNGVCTALYKDNDLNLRYCYKVIIINHLFFMFVQYILEII